MTRHQAVSLCARVARLREELASTEAELERLLASTGIPRAELEYEVAQRAAEAERVDETRCERCGWPLADSAERGCVPGNCSYRCGHRDRGGYREDCRACRYDRHRQRAERIDYITEQLGVSIEEAEAIYRLGHVTGPICPKCKWPLAVGLGCVPGESCYWVVSVT